MKKLQHAFTTWLIVYLLITTLFYVLHGWLIMMPIYMRTLLLSGIMVFAMQYLILPALQQYKKYNPNK